MMDRFVKCTKERKPVEHRLRLGEMNSIMLPAWQGPSPLEGLVCGPALSNTGDKAAWRANLSGRLEKGYGAWSLEDGRCEELHLAQ